MQRRLKPIYNATNYFENIESSNGLKTPSKYEFNTSHSHFHLRSLSTGHPATAYIYSTFPLHQSMNTFTSLVTQ